jgi:hypothetical protein
VIHIVATAGLTVLISTALHGTKHAVFILRTMS